MSAKDSVDAKDVIDIDDYIEKKAERIERAAAVTLDDFWAYMPTHSYIFVPTRCLWPASSVNAKVPRVRLTNPDGSPKLNDKGDPITMAAAAWLDDRRSVEQMTWAPGLPMIVEGRLIVDGGWIDRPGAHLLQPLPAAGHRTGRSEAGSEVGRPHPLCLPR
jgi:hypothetical protein